MTVKSDDWYRQMISLGVQMAEADARYTLVRKMQQVLRATPTVDPRHDPDHASDRVHI
jgi:hypothetical protein